MDKLYAYHRQRDGKRFEFYAEERGGRTVYIIREGGLQSQDSVTKDVEAVEAFRDGLIREGYTQVPFF